MRLRPAVPADADAVARLLPESRAAAMPWLAVVHDDPAVRRWTSEVLLPTHRVTVAEVEGALVGVCAVAGPEVGQLYVAPGAQGCGVGRALLDAAKDASPGRLELWTFARNLRARRFYAAAGFVEVGQTDGSQNEEREPDVRLSWDRPGRPS